jgi:hypothetical protein
MGQIVCKSAITLRLPRVTMLRKESFQFVTQNSDNWNDVGHSFSC